MKQANKAILVTVLAAGILASCADTRHIEKKNVADLDNSLEIIAKEDGLGLEAVNEHINAARNEVVDSVRDEKIEKEVKKAIQEQDPNIPSNVIEANYENRTINYLPIKHNYGTFTLNYGEIESNYGSITMNYGDIQNNYGNITQNHANIESNYQSITENFAGIGQNYGKITGNYGEIKIDQGAVNKNYYGTVSKQEAGTAKHSVDAGTGATAVDFGDLIKSKRKDDMGMGK